MTVSSRIDWKKIRSDFPMLAQRMHEKPLVYLDTAATAMKPRQVIDTVSDFYSHHYATVHRGIYELTARATTLYHEARQTVQQFLHAASTEEIVFTRGTTDGINLVATSFGSTFLQPDDEILISTMEHHANIVPWQLLCERLGTKLIVLPINDEGTIAEDVFLQHLGPRTKLVALCHISNVLGTVNPIQTFTKIAHEHGAKVLIDGAQAAPHMPVDVQQLGCDFYVFSGHKCYGPTGIGVLFGKKELLEQLPPHIGGGDMIETVTFEKTTYQKPPLRFEAGTPPIAQALGLAAALKYIQEIGIAEIEKRTHILQKEASSALEKIPRVRLWGPKEDRGPILSFTVDGVHPLDLATLMSTKGFAIRSGHCCAQPLMRRFDSSAVLRASFAFYNTPEEVFLFASTLKETIEQLLS